MEQNIKKQNDEIKAILQELETGISDLFKSDNYKHYLDVMSKFHHYSLNNSMLIFRQCPEATKVAGYEAWKKFERHVKKGEKGIKILAPAPYKKEKLVEKRNPKSNEIVIGKDGSPIMEKIWVTVPAFKVTKVFNITQTEGKDLPQIVSELKGTAKNYDEMIKALKDISPVPISFEEMTIKANGYFDAEEEKIVIRNDMSEMQTIKTLIHELGHALLHNKEMQNVEEKDRHTSEVEAESVAYCVCKHFGIDTSDYSFGYVALWSKEKELPELKSSMNTIRITASQIISKVEEVLKKDKEKNYKKENSMTQKRSYSQYKSQKNHIPKKKKVVADKPKQDFVRERGRW